VTTRLLLADVDGTLVTIDFPALDGETSAEQLLTACIAGEWADRGRDVLNQQREQFKSAYEAGRQAYKEATTEGAPKNL